MTGVLTPNLKPQNLVPLTGTLISTELCKSLFKRGRTAYARYGMIGFSPDCTESVQTSLPPLGSEVSPDAAWLSHVQVEPLAEVTTHPNRPEFLRPANGTGGPLPRSHANTAHVAARSSSLYFRISTI